MDSLAVLNPDDPSPGYCIYTGIAGGVTNRVFELYYGNGLRARMIVSGTGGLRYDEESDSIVHTGPLPEGITQDVVSGAGLTEVTLASPLTYNDFTKNLILYKALPAEQP